MPIDRVVIEILHRPELTVGMSRDLATRAARTLLRAGPTLTTLQAAGRAATGSGVWLAPDGAGSARGEPGSGGSGAAGAPGAR
jgi:hypothetical protein